MGSRAQRGASRRGVKQYHLAAEVAWKDVRLSGSVGDFSATGMAVLLKQRGVDLSPGDTVHVTFAAETESEPLQLTAEVRRVSTKRRLLRTQTIVGLQFGKLSAEKKEQLGALLKLVEDSDARMAELDGMDDFSGFGAV